MIIPNDTPFKEAKPVVKGRSGEKCANKSERRPLGGALSPATRNQCNMKPRVAKEKYGYKLWETIFLALCSLHTHTPHTPPSRPPAHTPLFRLFQSSMPFRSQFQIANFVIKYKFLCRALAVLSFYRLFGVTDGIYRASTHGTFCHAKLTNFKTIGRFMALSMYEPFDDIRIIEGEIMDTIPNICTESLTKAVSPSACSTMLANPEMTPDVNDFVTIGRRARTSEYSPQNPGAFARSSLRYL